MTFETFDQSDEESWHADQHFDNFQQFWFFLNVYNFDNFWQFLIIFHFLIFLTIFDNHDNLQEICEHLFDNFASDGPYIEMLKLYCSVNSITHSTSTVPRISLLCQWGQEWWGARRNEFKLPERNIESPSRKYFRQRKGNIGLVDRREGIGSSRANWKEE